jgi:hypothetical protein
VIVGMHALEPSPGHVEVVGDLLAVEMMGMRLAADDESVVCIVHRGVGRTDAVFAFDATPCVGGRHGQRTREHPPFRGLGNALIQIRRVPPLHRAPGAQLVEQRALTAVPIERPHDALARRPSDRIIRSRVTRFGKPLGQHRRQFRRYDEFAGHRRDLKEALTELALHRWQRGHPFRQFQNAVRHHYPEKQCKSSTSCGRSILSEPAVRPRSRLRPPLVNAERLHVNL